MSIVALDLDDVDPTAAPPVERFPARVVQPPYEVVHGSLLLADTPAGESVLVVDDGSDFEDSGDGGWVRLRLSADDDLAADLYVPYLTWEGDETDVETVTLVGPLDQAIPAGTQVDVWDPVDMRADSHYECLVVLDEPDAAPFPVDVKQEVLDALPPDADLARGQSVTLERIVGDDDIDLVSIDGDLIRDGNRTPMTVDAFDRTLGMKPAIIRTATSGARAEIDADGSGGYIRFVDDNGAVRGILRVIIDETGKAVCTLATGSGTGASRLRTWVMDDGTRRIDAITDQFVSNGTIIGTNSLTLQLSPTLIKGFDGNSNVTRVLSNEGKTTLPHTVAGGGTVHCMLRGGNSHLFNVSADLVTGSEIRFEFRYRADNQPAVNETVTFDWSITAYDRPTPVV